MTVQWKKSHGAKPLIGIYAGSFDPVTNGHMDIISRAYKVFDRVVVAVGINPKKTYTFSVEERVQMIKDACGLGERTPGPLDHLFAYNKPDIQVVHMDNNLLVHYAKSVGATHIIRGIRSHKDFDEESLMQRINKEIDSSIETIFFIPNKEFIDVSSSLVKTLTGPRYWQYVVRKYVPFNVVAEIAKKMFYEKLCGDEIGLAQNEVDVLWEKYCFKRKYHTPLHVLDLLSDFETVKDIYKGYRKEALFAIVFHDAEDSEEESYNLFASMDCARKENEQFRESVHRLIMATDHSRQDYEDFSNDEKIIHDLDLLILASEHDIYELYGQAVRKECIIKYDIERKDLNKKRIEFLEEMKKRESLFLHGHFRHLDSKAWNNMHNEIQKLKREMKNKDISLFPEGLKDVL